jgi:hypothetical protein
MYYMVTLLLKGYVYWNDMHTNCHMFYVLIFYALCRGICPAVVRAPDVRLGITCGAKAKTTGLGTSWKWYKRWTHSDNVFWFG